VDAEGLGQDGGGDLGGQGEQGGAAPLPRADPDGLQPLGERVLGERAPGPLPGEQPRGRDTEQAAPAGLAAVRVPGDEPVQRCGQHDRAAAQAQQGAVFLVHDEKNRRTARRISTRQLPIAASASRLE
jgi:hypothetical protein